MDVWSAVYISICVAGILLWRWVELDNRRPAAEDKPTVRGHSWNCPYCDTRWWMSDGSTTRFCPSCGVRNHIPVINQDAALEASRVIDEFTRAKEC